MLFLYKEVFGQDLQSLGEIGRPVPERRIPSVLTVAEVKRLLVLPDGQVGLLALLLNDSGMRLMECLSLRLKEMDFARHTIVVPEGKGGKYRVVMLPNALAVPLQIQL